MCDLHTLRAGRGPLLLLLHGIGSSATAWNKQFERLRGDFTCIAPDMPGYGDSPELSVASFDAIVKSIAEVLKNEPAHVVGVSFGALVALGLARQSPDLVLSLTLADATLGKANIPEDERAQWLAQRRTLSKHLAVMSVQRAAQIAGPGASTEVIQEIAMHMRRARVGGYMAVANAIAVTDARPWLGSLRMPSQVLCGEHDSVTGLDVSRTLAAHLPHARMITIPGAGHAPQIEAPDLFAQAVKGFIGDGDSRTAACQ